MTDEHVDFREQYLGFRARHLAESWGAVESEEKKKFLWL